MDISIKPLQIIFRVPDENMELLPRVDFRTRTIGERLEDLFLYSILLSGWRRLNGHVPV
jgi:hypothetical protein